LFFLKDSFAAMRIDHVPGEVVPAEVARYLDDTVAHSAIVVPMKDSHQYTTARKKVINWRNARRLAKKLVDKHVLRKRQEFGHIANHVSTHVRMLRNSRRLKACYTLLREGWRYVYYPLHVPGDMALTVRTPHLLNQLALIDYICRAVPHTHFVAIKEHPAMIGAVDATHLNELLERYDNLILLPPTINNYEVMAKADAIVSVNSKSGAEAGLIGRPVLVLGDAFYRGAPFAVAVDCLQELPDRLRKVLAVPGTHCVNKEAVHEYFARVWRHTHPGELYVSEPGNVSVFVRSLLEATSRTSPVEP